MYTSLRQACAKDPFDGDLRQATAETVLNLSHHAAILQSTLSCQCHSI